MTTRIATRSARNTQVLETQASKPTRRTPAERARAVKISYKIGTVAAAKQLGVPITTIWGWRARARKRNAHRINSSSSNSITNTLPEPKTPSGPSSSPSPLWLEGFRAGFREGFTFVKEIS